LTSGRKILFCSVAYGFATHRKVALTILSFSRSIVALKNNKKLIPQKDSERCGW